MDEQLYLSLARLTADRLKLERAQRRAGPAPQQLRLVLAETAGTSRAAAAHPVRTSVLARWFSQQLIWREQS